MTQHKHTPEGSGWKPISEYDTASKMVVEFSSWIVPSSYAQENGFHPKNGYFIAAAPETAAERDRLREEVRELVDAAAQVLDDYENSRPDFNGQPIPVRNSSMSTLKAALAKHTKTTTE